jgi:hypothetical protein
VFGVVLALGGAVDILRDRLKQMLGVELDELRGAQMSGECPVAAALVNRLIAAKLAGTQGPITAVRVEPLADNVIDVHVTPAARLIPAVRVQASVERQPEFPANPMLVLRWTMPVAGPLARLVAPVLSNLTSLPPGVRIDGDLVFVDLRRLLAAQGHAELLQYVRALRVDTRPGAFVVTFEVGC